MEVKKLLTPWNWFKKEEEQAQAVRTSNGRQGSAHPLSQLHRDLDQLFDTVFKGFPLSPFQRDRNGYSGGLLLPQVDIREGKKQYTITAEVPGVQEHDIDLSLDDGTLVIRGEKRSEHEEKDEQYHRIERSYGSFQRMLSLPADADENTVKATFKDGVLTITIAKNPSAKRVGRKIGIS